MVLPHQPVATGYSATDDARVRWISDLLDTTESTGSTAQPRWLMGTRKQVRWRVFASMRVARGRIRNAGRDSHGAFR